ncbi:hypothetical protein COMA1_20629 [Candidatus Nitrospira nitrosa]|uniref:Uncharacterized protein n=1 Tax=Candidatus Nitrospira nitrosa TaxID=1742972 RepID=A0A0S4LEN8_9BACT|nr:hypothetical protein COMA1_20629 [Candidatus Nitrospira nitrosa]
MDIVSASDVLIAMGMNMLNMGTVVMVLLLSVHFSQCSTNTNQPGAPGSSNRS